MVRRAIKTGQLKRGVCEVCGTVVGVHAHHDDYATPLDVRWLCKMHHEDHHKNQRSQGIEKYAAQVKPEWRPARTN